MYSVYLISNSCNDKKYVGVTSRPINIRFREHIYAADDTISQAPLHTAMRELGADRFTWTILESDVPEAIARERERYHIDMLNTLEPCGYNTYRAGMGGHHHSDTAKERISLGLQGVVYPDSRNARISAANRQIFKAENWCDNISSSRKGKYTKSNNSFYGKHHSKETLSRMIKNRKISRQSDVVCTFQDGSPDKIFHTLAEAGKWVMSSGLAHTSFRTCAERISRTIRHNPDQVLYGGTWSFKQRSID